MKYEEQLSKLFQDEAFKAEVSELKTAEELQAAFARHGVNITKDEVIDLCGAIAQQMDKGDEEELNEEALENVSGGIAFSLIALGVVCIGAVALGIWNGYNGAKQEAKK